MVEFKAFCESIKVNYGITRDCFLQELNTYLIDNKWFGIKPEWKDGKMYIEPSDFDPVIPKIIDFFDKSRLPEEERNKEIRKKLEKTLPDTSKKLEKFYMKFEYPVHIQTQVAAFILKFMKSDVALLSDAKLSPIIEVLCEEETKQVGDAFTTFLSWVRTHYKTRYFRDYVISKRYENSTNTAYDMDDYLRLIYFMYHPGYIKANDMYAKAARSRKYTDIWLYITLHLICALRDTDIVRIYRPLLTRTPEDVLVMIENDTFPEAEARETLYSITDKLKYLKLKPHKTENRRAVPYIKFHVPESAEVHIGKLAALAEAHRQVENAPDDEPLVRCIKTYEEISRTMGDEIGSLFLEGDFRARSANKSYLQSIFMMTDDIEGHDDNDFFTKGYMLAALARSHTGSYGEFAKTTYTYLKDAKFSGLTPEFVARELFERGVLSCIPSMLLKTLYGDEYKTLSVQNQTRLIKELNLTPAQVEKSVAVSNTNLKKSKLIVKQIFQTQSNEAILKALHRIGNGQAVSKCDTCECLMTAFGKICPFDDNRNCIDCDYEISTKTTLYIIASEYNRLLAIYRTSENVLEQRKCADIIKTIILPKMDEILRTAGDVYGEKTLETLETVIKEILYAA